MSYITGAKNKTSAIKALGRGRGRGRGPRLSVCGSDGQITNPYNRCITSVLTIGITEEQPEGAGVE